MLYENHICQCMGKIFCVGIFEIPHKISYPHIERCRFYPRVKVVELLDLRSYKCKSFRNAHPPPTPRSPEFPLTKDTPYLSLTLKLCDVCCEDFGGNWRYYTGIALYLIGIIKYLLFSGQIAITFQMIVLSMAFEELIGWASPTTVAMAWVTLRWRHNDHDGVSNYQPNGCLLNHLFRRRSKKTSKIRVTGLWAGNSPGPVNSPHKGPVTRKMFPFDDVIMEIDASYTCLP